MTSATHEATDRAHAELEHRRAEQPTLRDMLLLAVPTGVRISPESTRVAFTIQAANWNDNRYETVCYVHDVQTGETHQLTRTGNVSQMAWMDEETLALLKTGSGGNEGQIWLYEGLVGEGWQVTDHKTGVDWFAPFADGLLFRATRPDRKKRKERTDRFGTFTHVEQEESASAIYYTELAALRDYESRVKASTEDEAKKLVQPVVEISRLLGRPLAIREVVPAPQNDAIYVTCWPHDDLVYYRDTSTYRIVLDASSALTEYVRRKRAEKEADEDKDNGSEQRATSDEGTSEEDVSGEGASGEGASGEGASKDDVSYLGEITQLNLPRASEVIEVSPDGTHLLIAYQGRDAKMYTRQDLWVIDLDAALRAPDPKPFVQAMHNVTASIDRQVLD
ncbi:MAG: hypothetical protein ACP5JG_12140, partial [Anaerolineae bacterium]